MADSSIPLEERIERTDRLYGEAVQSAEAIEYDQEKYAKFLHRMKVYYIIMYMVL